MLSKRTHRLPFRILLNLLNLLAQPIHANCSCEPGYVQYAIRLELDSIIRSEIFSADDVRSGVLGQQHHAGSEDNRLWDHT